MSQHAYLDDPDCVAPLEAELAGAPAVRPAASKVDKKRRVLASPEAELYLLGAVLADPARLDLLTVELFTDIGARDIYAAACKAAGADKPVDVVTITEGLRQSKRLREAQPLLAELAAGLPTLDPNNFDAHLRTAEWWAYRRSIVADAQAVAGQAVEGDDITEAVDRLSRTAAGLGTSRALPPSWEPLNLTAALMSEHEPELPAFGLVADSLPLFYKGRVNAVNGESGAGKGIVTLAVAAQMLEAGETVAMLDYEDTEDSVVGRLLGMGVEVEAIATRFIYIRPDEPLPPAGCAALVRYMKERKVGYVIIDTVGEAMAMDGINPNADDEVARWFRMLARRLAHEAGCGVVTLDHVPKPQPGQSAQLFAIGSQRKRAALDGASYMLQVIRPPARGVPGLLKLVVAKDRHGTRSVGATAAEVTVDSNAAGTEIHVTITPSRSPVAADGKWKPTVLMERLSDALSEAGRPVSKNQAEKLVKGRAEHLRRALELLVEGEYVRLVPGSIQGRFDGFEHAKPYSADKDIDETDAAELI